MKEKKLSSLVLNKKVISRLNQSFIVGGDIDMDNSLDDGITGLTICTNSPKSRSCKCTQFPQTYPLPATTGCNTATDMPSRSCA
ncbi:hypothetical protein A1704_17335 [Chryseobacterium cucumeris]|uniref:hypothetical protein n=1 Tax=Chryseobacterium cucumeris TaxID=1813611 RepID=UPI000787B073|nr:hypothetical protein [Chryseobacterium cucumeris]KYH04458.1 hypothetical protein A1704_17335 [Chryseobacterium cucumeris]